jgi:hypothetical protein
MSPETGSMLLPLSSSLIINGAEGQATGGRQPAVCRENPAGNRQVVTVAAPGLRGGCKSRYRRRPGGIRQKR